MNQTPVKPSTPFLSSLIRTHRIQSTNTPSPKRRAVPMNLNDNRKHLLLGSQRARSQLSNEWSHRRATMPVSEVMPELKSSKFNLIGGPMNCSVHRRLQRETEVGGWHTFQFGHNFRYRHRSPTMRPLIGKLRMRSLWPQHRMLSIVIQILRGSTRLPFPSECGYPLKATVPSAPAMSFVYRIMVCYDT